MLQSDSGGFIRRYEGQVSRFPQRESALLTRLQRIDRRANSIIGCATCPSSRSAPRTRQRSLRRRGSRSSRCPGRSRRTCEKFAEPVRRVAPSISYVLRCMNGPPRLMRTVSARSPRRAKSCLSRGSSTIPTFTPEGCGVVRPARHYRGRRREDRLYVTLTSKQLSVSRGLSTYSG